MLWRFAERIEQAIKMGKIEGSAMNSRIIRRDESEDNSKGGKPYLCGLAMCHCSINCSNVFAKIYIPRLLEYLYQHLLDSRLIALTPSNPIQPSFSRWYNPEKRFEYHWGILCHSVEQLQEFQESSWVCDRWCHWSFCHQNILRMMSDRNCLTKHRYCQRS